MEQQRTQLKRLGTSGLNQVSEAVLGAAFVVHSSLSPGLLESAYEVCLEYELRERGLEVKRQLTLPVRYGEVTVDAGYRIDLFVENEVIVEVKSVRDVVPIHRAQLITYLRLSNRHLGLLLNFNVQRLKNGGIHRIVHGPPPAGE